MRTSIIAVVAVILLLSGMCCADTGFHEVMRVELNSAGGWDYLAYEPASNRVFVTRQTHIVVVDARSGTTVGDIQGTLRVHGVTFAPEFAKGFASDGRTKRYST